jgi:general secretion pathway protein D
VSNKESLCDGGIPLLKDIPVVGNLFRSHSKQKTRTELLLVIVPYIIESDEQAKVVTRAVIDSMQTMDATKLTTPLVPAAAPAADGRSPSIPAANPPAPPPAPGTAAPTQGATAPSDRRNVPSNN